MQTIWRLCERLPDPRGPQLSHQHSSPDWTCLKSYVTLWIPPSSLSRSVVVPTSPPVPPFPVPSDFHSQTTTTKAGLSQDKHSLESNQFGEVMVWLFQLNAPLTSRIKWSPHEWAKKRYICSFSHQTHKWQNNGSHWLTLLQKRTHALVPPLYITDRREQNPACIDLFNLFLCHEVNKKELLSILIISKVWQWSKTRNQQKLRRGMSQTGSF